MAVVQSLSFKIYIKESDKNVPEKVYIAITGKVNFLSFR